MKNLAIAFLISVFLTILSWTIPIFNEMFGLLCFPFMIFLFIGGLSGIILIPIGVIKMIKKEKLNKWLLRGIGLAFGFYIGWLFFQPINSWDKKQRELSGLTISEQLKVYNIKNGAYPDSLSQLNIEGLNEQLPINYKTSRFLYHKIENDFKLYYPGTFMSQWQWNDTEKKWIYRD